MPSAITTIKLLGLVGVVSYAAARVAVRLKVIAWHRAHVVAVPRSALPVMPRGFAVRTLEPTELAEHSIDIDHDNQAKRFEQGLHCLGAFAASGELAGVVWVGTGGCTEGEVALRFHPPAGCGWDTGMWVHPDHRLGRAFAALWAGVGGWMDARALSWSASSIADYNLSSLAAHRRLDMVAVGRMFALQIGPWQWIAPGLERWRLVRLPEVVDWQVPAPRDQISPRQAAPSLAA
jgi:hypothetical protein